MIVLAGDIGGTNTRLSLAEVNGKRVRLLHTERYLNAKAHGLAEHLRDFLTDRPRPEAACLAVAGPTDGHHAQLTNLPWAIDAQALAAEFQLPGLRLINDFQAVGHGIDALGPEDLAVLQAGQPMAQAPRAVLGAGTGLGVSLCTWNGHGYQPNPGEGGHIGFAPADAGQDALLAFLRGLYGRVSVERILSGQGIVDLYRFSLQRAGLADARPDAAAITQAALDTSDPQAVEAMRLFCRIYGQVAGDLALIAGAQGGVYIAGGIAPKIMPLLKNDGFMQGLGNKGRFGTWMRAIPVNVVMNEDIGLKGAALVAAG